jgi:CRISPR/Cas system CSM-associated protein Csm2 small subunit
MKRQESQMNSLFQRIQRIKNEQHKSRQVESIILIKRNKNLLKDTIDKQTLESRKTKKFLKYALGKLDPNDGQKNGFYNVMSRAILVEH